MAETHTRERFPKVEGRCPSCRGETLRLYDGYVTCSLIGCPNPTAVNDRLLAEPVQDTSTPPEGTDTREALRALVEAVQPVLAAHRSTTGHVTKEQITDAWAAFDAARKVVGA